MSAQRFCTIRASTLRNPAPVAGRTGAAVLHLSRLMITPIWPLSAATLAEMHDVLPLSSARLFLECYHAPLAGAALPDVRGGDRLVVAGVEYPISFVGEWAGIGRNDIACLRIIVQEVSGAR